MTPHLSRAGWLALETGSYVVDIRDRSMVRVTGLSKAFLDDVPGGPLDRICPVMFGRLVRNGADVGHRSKAPPPVIHRFEENRWCEVDGGEIFNVFFFAPEWRPVLPAGRPDRIHRHP